MGLHDWDENNRIQFSIDLSAYNYDITPVPFMFKISTSCGISNTNMTYLFDVLSEAGSSVINRKKIIFSQLVDGQEQALFTEIDSWDQVSRQAVLWVKPIELSCKRLNVFYLYFDKNHNTSHYITDTDDRTNVPTLFMDIGFEGFYDRLANLPMEVLKIDNLYKLWYLGSYSNVAIFSSIMYCESNDLVTWVNKREVVDSSASYAAKGHTVGTILHEDGIFKMWNAVKDSSSIGRIIYRESLDGISWTDEQIVIDIGQTSYAITSNIECTVIKDGDLYKMWYGGIISNCPSVIYCTSTDGILWENHVMVISHNILRSTDRGVRPSKVIIKDSIYTIYLTVALAGNTLRIYTAESLDGMQWYGFKAFSWVNNLTSLYSEHIGYLNCFFDENTKKYIFHYGTHDSYRWRTLQSRSYFLDSLHTPANKVWASHFNSVHHFNPIFSDIDSTINRLDVIDTNATAITTSMASTGAISLLNNDSYINLGNDSKYDISKEGSIVLFSKFTSGTDVMNKGHLRGTNFFLYAQNFEPYTLASLDDDFVGNNGDSPNPLLWFSAEGSAYIQDNKLRIDTSEDIEILTTYYIFGDTDIRINFKLQSYALNKWDSGIALKLSNGTYYKISIRHDGTCMLYYLEYKAAYGSWTGTTSSIATETEGAFRILINGADCDFMFWDNALGNWVYLNDLSNRDALSMQICIIRHTYDHNTSDVVIDYSNFTVTPVDFRLVYNAEKKDTLALDLSSVSEQYNETLTLHKNIINSDWSVYVLGKSDTVGINTSLFENYGAEVSTNSSDLKTNTDNLYIGSSPVHSPRSIIGTVAEAWFVNSYIDKNTTIFLGESFKDNIINISKYYVEGYTTLYNKTISTKVLIYDVTTKCLIGTSYSSDYNGYYYIETPLPDECFMVATSPDNYNYMIRGKILPRLI